MNKVWLLIHHISAGRKSMIERPRQRVKKGEHSAMLNLLTLKVLVATIDALGHFEIR